MKKIEVLKKALDMLNNGFEYNFTDVDRCNCGVVLKAAGLTSAEINETESLYSYTYFTNIGHCSVTGMPFCKVQAMFIQLGFTKNDIINLEKLSDETILSKAGNLKNYANKNNLIKYLTAWIEILEEETPYQVTHLYIPHIVKIDESILIEVNEN